MRIVCSQMLAMATGIGGLRCGARSAGIVLPGGGTSLLYSARLRLAARSALPRLACEAANPEPAPGDAESAYDRPGIGRARTTTVALPEGFFKREIRPQMSSDPREPSPPVEVTRPVL